MYNLKLVKTAQSYSGLLGSPSKFYGLSCLVNVYKDCNLSSSILSQIKISHTHLFYDAHLTNASIFPPLILYTLRWIILLSPLNTETKIKTLCQKVRENTGSKLKMTCASSESISQDQVHSNACICIIHASLTSRSSIQGY